MGNSKSAAVYHCSRLINHSGILKQNQGISPPHWLPFSLKVIVSCGWPQVQEGSPSGLCGQNLWSNMSVVLCLTGSMAQDETDIRCVQVQRKVKSL